jgi:transcriptional regulator GlxA family with amidase domain
MGWSAPATRISVRRRPGDFGARYRVLQVSPTGQSVGTTAFTRLSADFPVSDAPDSIDTLLVPGGVPADFTFASGTHDIPEELTPDTVPEALAMVHELAPRASRIASVRTGAFVLAALGMLDGRRATTHWAHCARLAREYPSIEVDPDAVFVQDGTFVTGAGISAGTDMASGYVLHRSLARQPYWQLVPPSCRQADSRGVQSARSRGGARLSLRTCRAPLGSCTRRTPSSRGRTCPSHLLPPDRRAGHLVSDSKLSYTVQAAGVCGHRYEYPASMWR